jgi:hypothetical protein
MRHLSRICQSREFNSSYQCNRRICNIKWNKNCLVFVLFKICAVWLRTRICALVFTRVTDFDLSDTCARNLLIPTLFQFLQIKASGIKFWTAHTEQLNLTILSHDVLVVLPNSSVSTVTDKNPCTQTATWVPTLWSWEFHIHSFAVNFLVPIVSYSFQKGILFGFSVLLYQLFCFWSRGTPNVSLFKAILIFICTVADAK